jgi:hypothetical protein
LDQCQVLPRNHELRPRPGSEMAVVGDELIEISLLDDFSLEDGANARIKVRSKL